jgi:3-methyladenine DNA glycosylase AlkC
MSLATKINDLTIKIEQEGSYTDKELEEILDKHLKYYSKTGVINEEEKVYALTHKDEIVSELRFPHNYELFVREELNRIFKDEISLDKAIDNAKNIKRVVEKWFLHLPNDEKHFVFTVALFPGLDEQSFNKVYNEVIKSLQMTPSSTIETLRKKASAYITESGKIYFKHPTYWEGVMNGITKNLRLELHTVIPILEKLIKDKDTGVQLSAAFAFIEVGKTVPDKVMPILDRLAKDKDTGVRVNAAVSLGKIGKTIPDRVLPSLERLAKDKNANVREIAKELIARLKHTN